MRKQKKKVLLTGIAGFIGFHTALCLLENEYEVVGIDNLNDYYDVNLKLSRLGELGISKGETQSSKFEDLRFHKLDLSEETAVLDLFAREDFNFVIHLAAQAGVRYSIENPLAYIKSNAEGFLHILEGCRHNDVEHLIYASSSSVYGKNAKTPFSTEDPVDHPVSLYAATKRSNELMAHTYSHLYKIPTTGLRFFTVYGPWGRPDMAPFLFAQAITKGDPIKVFNKGDMERDFTYVTDIVEAMVKLIPVVPAPGEDCRLPNRSTAPFRIFNIGSSKPSNLLKFISVFEKALGKEAIKEMCPIQPGDVQKTFADVEDLFKVINYKPTTGIEQGVTNFVKWFKEYYEV